MDTLSNSAAGLIRHGLTTAGGGLVTQGLVTNDQLQTAIGALLTLAGVVWSVGEKIIAAKLAAGQAPKP